MSAAKLAVRVLPVTPFQQNCSLIFDEVSKIGAIVDPGGDLDNILALVKSEGVAIEKILITHAHLDHAAGTAELSRRLKVPVEGPHEGDRFWIEAMPAQAAEYGFKHGESFEPDRWLNDGDRVTVGPLEFEVRHCPGHTPGHVVFFHAPSRFAIVGDVIFAGSIGRTDFPRGNHADLIHSIRNNLFVLGDDVQFLPGHGGLSTFGTERKSNPYVSDRAVGATVAPTRPG